MNTISSLKQLTSVEICAGAGGQALGLEMAGFHHLALVEMDKHACATLRYNRPQWNVVEADVREVSVASFSPDLLAGGVPCPPFSIAGKKLGPDDERNLFPEAIRLVRECQPKAVMLENVRGLLDHSFAEYRTWIQHEIESMGYMVAWKLLNACDYGVPQLRPRTLLVALRPEIADYFSWPSPIHGQTGTVGSALFAEMSSLGWQGVHAWHAKANQIAPTLVGGSKKHGGPDLGPTRSRQAWATLGIDGIGIADSPPLPDFIGMPRLTVPMAATLQGFPKEWVFTGGKTAAYRQVGNASPPPVAAAVGQAIVSAIQECEYQKRGIA